MISDGGLFNRRCGFRLYRLGEREGGLFLFVCCAQVWLKGLGCLECDGMAGELKELRGESCLSSEQRDVIARQSGSTEPKKQTQHIVQIFLQLVAQQLACNTCCTE
jgi:hypothetical protein